MAAGLRNKGFLDPKSCWKDWHVNLGSLGAVQDKMLKDGNINGKTGNVATKSGIEKAAFAWAIENQKEAREDLEFAWGKEGHVLRDEDWDRWLYNAAKLVFHQRPNRFEEFVSRNGLKSPV